MLVLRAGNDFEEVTMYPSARLWIVLLVEMLKIDAVQLRTDPVSFLKDVSYLAVE